MSEQFSAEAFEQAVTASKQTREVFTPPIGPLPKMPPLDGRNIGVMSTPSKIENPTDGVIRNPAIDPTREAIRNPVTFPTTLGRHQDSCAQSIGQICNIGPNVTVGRINQSGDGKKSIRLGIQE